MFRGDPSSTTFSILIKLRFERTLKLCLKDQDRGLVDSDDNSNGYLFDQNRRAKRIMTKFIW